MTVQTSEAGSLSYSQEPGDKTPDSRRMRIAVDFAYTLNHALVCTVTDPMTDVPIGMMTQKWLGNKGEHSAKHWILGELMGDFGAVPIVVALRHSAPKFVEGIGKIIEPIARPFLKRATTRAAKREAEANGMPGDAAAIQQRADELYQREADHLPEAVLWTAISPMLNIATQKLAGNQTPIPHLALGKAIGSTVTSSLTVGMRNLSPRKAQAWDDMLSNKVIGPVSSAVAHLFRLDKEKVQAGVTTRQQEEKSGGWASREDARRAVSVQQTGPAI